MGEINNQPGLRGWWMGREGMLVATLALGFFVLMYQSGLLRIWLESEEYGHGLMVLAVLGYLVARQRDSYLPVLAGSVVFVVVLGVIAMLLVVLGKASGIPLVAYYGIWLFVAASVFALGGFGLCRKLVVPMLIVLLLFPLPNPLGPMVTSELQLISSRLGVWLIRSFGGSVFLEGNVLDMGGAKLLVAEACAGLRYLFPLMSLGAIAGFVLGAPLWIRWTVFLSTVPITIFMNSFRIAATGLLVEHTGMAHTEGLLHLFEGWAVFIAASLLLIGVASILIRTQPSQHRLFDALTLRGRTSSARELPVGLDMTGKSAWATSLPIVAILIVIAVAGSSFVERRGEYVPERQPLGEFPALIGEWGARVDRLPSFVEEIAGASEYFYGDFSSPSGGLINAYVSYYRNQRHGQIPHSPKVCIPGGGWRIESLDPVLIHSKAGRAVEANRLVTAQGGERVIAYYWLKQGPRTYRNEFLARFDLVRSSLLEDRTDGALIRLVTEMKSGEEQGAADERLRHFAAIFIDVIPRHVPD